MRKMSSVTLKLTRLPSNDVSHKVSLHKDSLPFVIGRGILNINDARISKAQVEIKLTNDQCNIFHRGINPSYLQTLQRYNELKLKSVNVSMKELLGTQLESTKSYPLNNKDIVSFLIPDADPIQIQLEIDQSLKNEMDNDDQHLLMKRIYNEEKNENNIDENNDNDNESVTKKAKKEITTTTSTTSSNTKEKETINKKPAPTPHSGRWSDALLPYCKSPEDHKDAVVYYDNDIVIIKDYYPKAKYHFLTMPRRIIPSLNELKVTDLKLLENMYEKATEFIQNQLKKDLNQFQIGFHAIPSMRQLHMHMISKDFDSPSLKKKEHWISFTTDFFIPYQSFYNNLETNKEIIIDKEKFKSLKDDKNPYKCPKCSVSLSNLPKVKEHYKSCYTQNK